jgi:hypothetical protein
MGPGTSSGSTTDRPRPPGRLAGHGASRARAPGRVAAGPRSRLGPSSAWDGGGDERGDEHEEHDHEERRSHQVTRPWRHRDLPSPARSCLRTMLTAVRRTVPRPGCQGRPRRLRDRRWVPRAKGVACAIEGAWGPREWRPAAGVVRGPRDVALAGPTVARLLTRRATGRRPALGRSSPASRPPGAGRLWLRTARVRRRAQMRRSTMVAGVARQNEIPSQNLPSLGRTNVLL